MGRKQKYYVVWKGVEPGVYATWTDCLLQTKGYKGAIYKSFDTKAEAEEAFARPPGHYRRERGQARPTPPRTLPPEVEVNAIAVDAACSGNPGMMEYRGVYVGTQTELFHFGPIWGTNNIGEFLAIVHAMAWMQQKRTALPIYSDSRNAMKWIKQKKCQTKLQHNDKSAKAYELIARAETWLQQHTPQVTLHKWNTREWGEIPADFGRK